MKPYDVRDFWEKKMLERDKRLLEIDKMKPALDFLKEKGFSDFHFLSIQRAAELMEEYHAKKKGFYTEKNEAIELVENIFKRELAYFEENNKKKPKTISFYPSVLNALKDVIALSGNNHIFTTYRGLEIVSYPTGDIVI